MPSFLLDSNTSPSTAAILRSIGIEAVHIEEIGRDTLSDATIVQFALDRGDVIVTYDNDFPEMMAFTDASKPSVILLREGSPIRPAELAGFPGALSDDIAIALDEGAIVSHDGRKTRIRRLPLR